MFLEKYIAAGMVKEVSLPLRIVIVPPIKLYHAWLLLICVRTLILVLSSKNLSADSAKILVLSSAKI